MTGELLPHLNADESARLAELEAVVRSGLDTFVTVGRALAEIRDGRLYREAHGTFEAYCDQQWSLSRPRAYELIAAASTVDSMSAMADTPVPTNERQARQLTGLPTETAAAVMRKAHEDNDGRVTAATIREARQEIAPKVDPWAARIAVELAASDDAYAERAATLTPSPAVTDYLASSEKLRDSGYVREFLKALARSDYLTFDAERLAELLTEDEAAAVYRQAASANRFADTLRRGRSGLRVIPGGK